jgi:hypothetical protein
MRLAVCVIGNTTVVLQSLATTGWQTWGPVILQSPLKRRQLPQQNGMSLGSVCTDIQPLTMRSYRVNVTQIAACLPRCQTPSPSLDWYLPSWRFECWTNFFPAEAWIHVSQYVNSQNSRLWNPENQNAYHNAGTPGEIRPVLSGVSVQ